MEPNIMDAALDQFIQPALAQEIVDIGLANAGGDAGEHFVLERIVQSTKCFVQHVFFSAPLVTDHLPSFNADERRHIAKSPQPRRNLVGDKLAIGKNLKVAIRMGFQNIQQLRMHEGLATEDPKKHIPIGFSIGDQTIHRFKINAISRGCDINPTALTAKIAAIDNGNVNERRKVLAPLQAALETLHR